MDKYKKKSFGFANEFESRELRVVRRSIDRRSAKDARLSILRNVNVDDSCSSQECLEHEEGVKQEQPSRTDVPILEKKPSRLDMLMKWKQEKELKKRMEARKQKPAFRVPVVTHKLAADLPSLPVLKLNSSSFSNSSLGNALNSKLPVTSKLVRGMSKTDKEPQSSQMKPLRNTRSNDTQAKSSGYKPTRTASTSMQKATPIHKVKELGEPLDKKVKIPAKSRIQNATNITHHEKNTRSTFQPLESKKSTAPKAANSTEKALSKVEDRKKTPKKFYTLSFAPSDYIFRGLSNMKKFDIKKETSSSIITPVDNGDLDSKPYIPSTSTRDNSLSHGTPAKKYLYSKPGTFSNITKGKATPTKDNSTMCSKPSASDIMKNVWSRFDSGKNAFSKPSISTNITKETSSHIAVKSGFLLKPSTLTDVTQRTSSRIAPVKGNLGYKPGSSDGMPKGILSSDMSQIKNESLSKSITTSADTTKRPLPVIASMKNDFCSKFIASANITKAVPPTSVTPKRTLSSKPNTPSRKATCQPATPRKDSSNASVYHKSNQGTPKCHSGSTQKIGYDIRRKSPSISGTEAKSELPCKKEDSLLQNVSDSVLIENKYFNLSSIELDTNKHKEADLAVCKRDYLADDLVKSDVPSKLHALKHSPIQKKKQMLVIHDDGSTTVTDTIISMKSPIRKPAHWTCSTNNNDGSLQQDLIFPNSCNRQLHTISEADEVNDVAPTVEEVKVQTATENKENISTPRRSGRLAFRYQQKDGEKLSPCNDSTNVRHTLSPDLKPILKNTDFDDTPMKPQVSSVLATRKNEPSIDDDLITFSHVQVRKRRSRTKLSNGSAGMYKATLIDIDIEDPKNNPALTPDRPLTRNQRRISLLGSPVIYSPRKSIRGNLISFSPI